MLSGPELLRVRKQFESEYFSDNDPDNPQNFLNHEQGLSTQKTFQRQVTSLSSIIRKMGNPFFSFLADFSDFVSLDSRDCADESVIAALYDSHDGKDATDAECPPTTHEGAVYQACIWVRSTEVQQMIPSPNDYGWGQVDNVHVWSLLWLTVPELFKACQDLIKCTCKGDCSNCKCGKANLKCSPLCNCNCNSYCSARRQVR